eukprot:510983_1
MAQPKESMDVNQSNDTNSNNTNNTKNTNNKPKETEYELSVQLAIHNSPARCVVGIDNNTIVSAGIKYGEFILLKRMQQNNTETNANTNTNNNNDEDKDEKKK